MQDTLTMAVAFTLIGGGVMGAGLFSGITSERLVKRGRLGRGVVTNIIPDINAGTMRCYAVEFRYEDQEGGEHLIQASEESSIVTLKIGQAVRVLYDPADPALAKIDTFGQMWLVAIMMSLIGGIFFVIGVVSWWQVWEKSS